MTAKTVAELQREALIKLARTHAWLAFGEIRAFNEFDSGRILSDAEASELARAALLAKDDDQ